MSILLLAGSPSIPSRSTRLLQHVTDLPAEVLLHADFNNTDIKLARLRVAEVKAVVIGTPVYKVACSGVLKAFLDLLPQDGLAGKLVLPLATGGSQSHMLALEALP